MEILNLNLLVRLNYYYAERSLCLMFNALVRGLLNTAAMQPKAAWGIVAAAWAKLTHERRMVLMDFALRHQRSCQVTCFTDQIREAAYLIATLMFDEALTYLKLKPQAIIGEIKTQRDYRRGASGYRA